MMLRAFNSWLCFASLKGLFSLLNNMFEEVMCLTQYHLKVHYVVLGETKENTNFISRYLYLQGP